MRIGLLIYDLRSGGAERVLCKWSELLSNDHEISLYAFDGTSEPAYPFCGDLKILNVPSHGKNKIKQILSVIKRGSVLARAIKKDKIELLISFCSTANFPTMFQSCKKVASIRLYSEYFSYKKFYRFLIKHTKTQLIVQTERLKRDILLDVGDKYSKKIDVIPNPLDVSAIRKKMDEQPDDEFLQKITGKKVICFTASFKTSKNHWNLLKSFSLLLEKIPNALLVLIGGEGELEEKIHRMVKESKIEENVVFVGKTNNPFMYEKYADLFVLPSLYEGIPNVLLEALAVGLPVISTDCPSGPREILMQTPDLSKCTESIDYADYGVLVKPFPNLIDYDWNMITEENCLLAKAMETMLLDNTKKSEYQINSQKRAAKYDMAEYEVQLKNMVRSIN